MHSQATTYARLAESTASNSGSTSSELAKELTDESGLLTVLPVSAESAGLLPNRRGNSYFPFQLSYVCFVPSCYFFTWCTVHSNYISLYLFRLHMTPFLDATCHSLILLKVGGLRLWICAFFCCHVAHNDTLHAIEHKTMSPSKGLGTIPSRISTPCNLQYTTWVCLFIKSL